MGVRLLSARLRILQRAAQLQLAPTRQLATSARIQHSGDGSTGTPWKQEQQERHADLRSERWRTYSESNRPGAGDAAVAHASRGRARRPWRGGRKYRSRGRVLVEEAESLGVNILGRPGQAIVLRDDEFERHPSELEAAEGDNAPPETLTDGSQPMQEELVKLLEDEGQSVSWEEVRANIEALRPQPSVGTSSLSLPTGAFNELLKKLHNGFTQRQLLTYFKTYDVGEAVATTAKKESGDAGAVVATPGLLRTLPWAPIADAPLDRELRMHKTSKGKLARKILSDCWGLVEADPADTLGTATLFLEPSNLLLPPHFRSRWQSQVSSLLGVGERLDASVAEASITIVAHRPVAERIIEDLKTVLRMTRTATLPLSDLPAKADELTPEVLSRLGILTDSLVVVKGGGPKRGLRRLVVKWLAGPEEADDLETPFDVVVRMIRSAYGPAITKERLAISPDVSWSESRLVAAPEKAQDLSWEYQGTTWSRLITSAPLSKTKGKPPRNAILKPFNMPDDWPFHPLRPGNTSEPQATVHCTTTATFGTVLHAGGGRPSSRRENSTEDSLVMRLDRDNLQGRRRLLVPVCPPSAEVLRLLRSGDGIDNTDKDSANSRPLSLTNLVIRFVPETCNANRHAAISVPPTLEFAVPVDAVTGTLAVPWLMEESRPPSELLHQRRPRLRAIFAAGQPTARTDALRPPSTGGAFPSSAVDVRLEQHVWAELALPTFAAESADDFAENSYASLLTRFLRRCILPPLGSKPGSVTSSSASLGNLVRTIRLPRSLGNVGLPAELLPPTQQTTSVAGGGSDIGNGNDANGIPYVLSSAVLQRHVVTAPSLLRREAAMSPLRYTTTIPIPGPPSASPFATSDNSYGHEHHDDDPRLALLRPTTELALESDGRWYYHHDDNAVADPVDSATAGADFVSAVATLAWDRTKGIRWT